MKLHELQKQLKDAGAKPDCGSFMMLDARAVCQWVDVWLGAFACHELAPNGVFYVSDFGDRDVVPL